MKISSIVLLASTAAAGPLGGLDELSNFMKRQFGGLSSTSNELEDGACKKVTFIFARGSTEPGNMGTTVGPSTCSSLKQAIGANDVACQGVGNGYLAGIETNALPGGTSSGAIQASEGYFNDAHKKCPDTIIVAGGYSIKNQIAGVVLYGDTQNQQTGGSIPDFPKDKVKVYCAASDGVCGGALIVTAGHLSYAGDVPAATQYLQQQIASTGTGSDSSGSGSASSSDPGSSDGSDSGSSTSSSSGFGSLGSETSLGSLSPGSSLGSFGSGSSLGSLGSLGSLTGSSGSSSSGLGSLGSLSSLGSSGLGTF